MPISKILVGAVVLGVSFSTVATARTVKSPSAREQQEQACYNDAMTLCKDDVPDEAKITACMRQKQAQLSPGCAKMFEAGTPAKKRRR